jgi:hypothetical protein
MIEVWHWEDDPDAEDVIEFLKRENLEFEAHTLDAEVPSATPYVQAEGKTYWDFREFLRAMRAS